MSLTSYRAAPPRVIFERPGQPGFYCLSVLAPLALWASGAAPPRVTRFLPKAKYRLFAFPGPAFAGGKMPLYVIVSHFQSPGKQKGRFVSGLDRARGPVLCREDDRRGVFGASCTHLPLADLAATYSPAS